MKNLRKQACFRNTLDGDSVLKQFSHLSFNPVSIIDVSNQVKYSMCYIFLKRKSDLPGGTLKLELTIFHHNTYHYFII